jgi:hypothetical protein
MTSTVSQLRELSELAAVFSPGRVRAIRVTTRDGTVHTGAWTRPRYDFLVLGQRGKWEGSEIPLAEIQRLEWRELRLRRAIAAGAAVAAVGAVCGALMQARWGTSEMVHGRGMVLGIMLGTLVASFVIRLLQDLAPLHRWEVWTRDGVIAAG